MGLWWKFLNTKSEDFRIPPPGKDQSRRLISCGASQWEQNWRKVPEVTCIGIPWNKGGLEKKEVTRAWYQNETRGRDVRSLLKDRLRGWWLIRNQCQRKGGIQDDVERSRLGKSGRENGSVCTKIIGFLSEALRQVLEPETFKKS